MDLSSIWVPTAIFSGAAILTSLRILWQYERAVVFRLGKLTGSKGPGLLFLVPFFVERMRRVDLRIRTLDIAPQDTITRDNVSVKINAVVYYRVMDPVKAVVEIEDYHFAVSQLAQTTLRSVIGQSELDEVLAKREQINEVIRDIIDEGTDPWGLEVTAVEIKDIDLPQEMKRAMAKQAEAERERRAKVIGAEGEYQASQKLAQAARIIAQEPIALQLRFLQTAVEVAAEKNSTTLFPLPIDLLRPFLQAPSGGATAAAPERARASLPAGDDAPRRVEGADAELVEAARQVLAIASRARDTAAVREAEASGDDAGGRR
ncbi:MAG: slipin family protein [Gemmatimonadetes bacterium]|nr:slipin family protein [Gemmatimonadota bacterium]